ncbi:MAG TPA: glutathione S-transferase [Hyphomicrobiaceae bacterium]|nr:glutathione S-transferase [Hyphomicrobiaceae bacterium]
MKIIEQVRAPNPRRVRIFLAEKGVGIPFEQVDLGKLEHKSAEFEALNPFISVPVLVLDDGIAISETMAICRYFEAVQPDPNLMGSGPLEIAQIEMWARRMELELFYRVAQCFRHNHPAMAALETPQVPEWGEANRPRALKTLEIMDGVLAGREFIAGDRFSVADITALVAIDFMKPARIERPAGLTSLDRWYNEVSARASAAA